MMLKKRSRPVLKDQSKGYLMSHSTSDGVVKKSSTSSFLSVPGLLVGFTSKGSSDCDAVWSPTSPLDKVFSSRGNSNLGSPTPASSNGRPKCWDSSRVGLGLVDSLKDDDEAKPCGKAWRNRNIVFGSQMKFNISIPKSCPAGLRTNSPGGAPVSLSHDCGIPSQQNFVSSKFHSNSSGLGLESKEAKLQHEEFVLLQSCSVDTGRLSLLLAKSFCNSSSNLHSEVQSDSMNSVFGSTLAKGNANFEKLLGSLPISLDSSHWLLSTLSASEIEQSEDYTCIISHGPNPKMTHIFGDCILESHNIESPSLKKTDRKEEKGCTWPPKLPGNSVSCSSCKKKLEEGKDNIFMHRNNKAFHSCECCDQETLIGEKMKKPSLFSAGSPGSSFNEETLLDEMALASWD
ncbi:FCS-Like Zinc finger 8-like [Curcuma longa]|uniref:FCS-Like Zinc finger 8-like n=1 Tax=Curcuma longa TaxID=136217 RepID=UPI003D9F06CC